jgi:hypothetical protein
MKCQMIRFRTLVHFGKGQHTDMVQLGDPRNRWVAEIEVDMPSRLVKVSTRLEGLHPAVMVPLENVTSWIPLAPSMPKQPEAKAIQPVK